MHIKYVSWAIRIFNAIYHHSFTWGSEIVNGDWMGIIYAQLHQILVIAGLCDLHVGLFKYIDAVHMSQINMPAVWLTTELNCLVEPTCWGNKVYAKNAADELLVEISLFCHLKNAGNLDPFFFFFKIFLFSCCFQITWIRLYASIEPKKCILVHHVIESAHN